MAGYYTDNLSAGRLRLCYDIAPLRVRQYLEAEIQHVLSRIRPRDLVLELGCGFGRVLERLLPKAGAVVGIDASPSSLQLARELHRTFPDLHLAAMNAISLGFPNAVFDVVICIQNGISAFDVNQQDLMSEAVRVVKPGGAVLFSSYSDRFWEDRLAWLEQQAEHGLIGEIDRQRTRDGVIVCRDGFKATTIGRDGFRTLTAALGLRAAIEEVDGSSIFCEINPG